MIEARPCLHAISYSKAAAICTVLGHTVQVQDVITLVDEHVRMSASLGCMQCNPMAMTALKSVGLAGSQAAAAVRGGKAAAAGGSTVSSRG